MASNGKPVSTLHNKTPVKETWRDFLWNSEKSAFLGRTGGSWLKIGLFYAVFYACLAGWFTGMLHGFYSSLNETAPTYYGNNSLLQSNPAMGMRPMPIHDSTMIRFSQGKMSSYRPYTDHLEAFFMNYEYSPASSNCTGNDTVPTDIGCNIDINSYLKALDAGRDKDYGYMDGTPVVALKMNKLFDFTPKPFDSKEEIEELLEDNEALGHLAFAPGHVGVGCAGINAVDRQFIGDIEYYPPGGFPMKYYPYLNQKGYRAPVVLAKFNNVKKRVTIQVVCRVWAKNIDNTDGKQKRGSVHFELYID